MLAAPNFSPEKLRIVRVVGLRRRRRLAGPDPRACASSFGCFAYPLLRHDRVSDGDLRTARRSGGEVLRAPTAGRRPAASCARSTTRDGPSAAGVEGELELFGPQMCVGYLDPDARTSRLHRATATCARATSASWTPRASSASPAAGRTSSSARARTSPRRASRTTWPRIRDVVDVAVVGVPDRDSGERVCACVVHARRRGDAHARRRCATSWRRAA